MPKMPKSISSRVGSVKRNILFSSGDKAGTFIKSFNTI